MEGLGIFLSAFACMLYLAALSRRFAFHSQVFIIFFTNKVFGVASRPHFVFGLVSVQFSLGTFSVGF